MDKIEYTNMYKLEDSHFWFVGKRYIVDSILKKYQHKIRKILDLGSGTGGMTKHLQRYGTVTGIEKSPYGLSLARKRKIKILSGSIEKLNFKNKSFDLVTIFDVLYHKNIPDENKVLGEANRVLKKGGYLLVTDSALRFLTSQHDIVNQGKTRYYLSEMEEMIEKQNFKIIKASYIFFSIFPIIFFKRFVFDKLLGEKDADDKQMSRIFNTVLLSLIRIEAKLLNYVSYPIGSSLIVLAVKK